MIISAILAGLSLWDVLWGGLYVTSLAALIYETYQSANDPNIDLAKTLRAAQKKQVQAAARKMAMRENIETEMSMARTRRNQRLLSTKMGLESGAISAVEKGIRGGGYAARDVPLIRQVAAQVGMDPEDLAARFDPTRVGPYTSPGRGGNGI